jgi:hypothetical protein
MNWINAAARRQQQWRPVATAAWPATIYLAIVSWDQRARAALGRPMKWRPSTNEKFRVD